MKGRGKKIIRQAKARGKSCYLPIQHFCKQINLVICKLGHNLSAGIIARAYTSPKDFCSKFNHVTEKYHPFTVYATSSFLITSHFWKGEGITQHWQSDRNNLKCSIHQLFRIFSQRRGKKPRAVMKECVQVCRSLSIKEKSMTNIKY